MEVAIVYGEGAGRRPSTQVWSSLVAGFSAAAATEEYRRELDVDI